MSHSERSHSEEPLFGGNQPVKDHNKPMSSLDPKNKKQNKAKARHASEQSSPQAKSAKHSDQAHACNGDATSNPSGFNSSAEITHGDHNTGKLAHTPS